MENRKKNVQISIVHFQTNQKMTGLKQETSIIKHVKC